MAIAFPADGDKRTLRAWARAMRGETDSDAATDELLLRLFALPEWQVARRVLLYYSLPGEVRAEQATTDAEGGKTFYLPRCAANRRLTIHAYSPGGTPLVTTAWGLREPDAARDAETDPTALDLVIVPALLASEGGDRLGYGGGYYDRFLPRLRANAVTVILLPDAFVLPILPTEPHDVPVQIVVTPTRTFRRADTTAPTPHPY